MELTANTMNADLKDSCEKTDLCQVETKEKIIVKEEYESEENEEVEECVLNPAEISRQVMLLDLELDELEESMGEISKLAQKQTRWAVSSFTCWLESQGLQVDLATVHKTELNTLLRRYYGSVRNSKGELYGICSYLALRAGLNRVFKIPPLNRPVNIMRDVEFTSANKVFLGVLRKIRKSGLDMSSSHPTLSPDDILILRRSKAMDTSTPKGLLNKVWFDIQVHFGRRGKQANRKLRKDSFVLRQDGKGLRYLTLSLPDEAKTHNEKETSSMFEKPGNEFCPVTSLLKYISKFPPKAVDLYLQPKKEPTDQIWYSHLPLGVNSLGAMLSRMSKEACTSTVYTNHCISTTPFQVLCDAEMEAAAIIPVIPQTTVRRTEITIQILQAPPPGVPKPLRKILPKIDSNCPAGLPLDKGAPLIEDQSKSAPRPPSLEINNEDFLEDFPLLHSASHSNYIPDAVLPPGEPWLDGGPSRAALSLPSCLCMCENDASGMSGPGEVCKGQMPTNLKYAWAIRDDASFVYIDASDESKSNWMRYVTYTSNEEERNLVIFQFYRHIYYRVSQPIMGGAELKVSIGKDYAALLGLGTGDNGKCDVGDKETILRLLQDIQLVTLPEPSSSSLWSDNSQSQSPMLLISDVTTMSNPDAASDSTCGPSLISLPSPCLDKLYDFLPGTEKLLSNSNTLPNSPWFFFGFEPDPTGRPLDRSTGVCKLCREHVGCGGGPADLQIHLTNKHHIKTRDASKDRSHPCTGQQRSQPVMVNSGLVSTLPLVSSVHVTNAIVNFLIKDLQPPTMVGGDGFKQLMHILLPAYKELLSTGHLEHLLKEQHSKGKTSLALLLSNRIVSSENEEIPDYTAPLEFESRRRGRPPNQPREVPHFVTLSVDVWFHNWQGKQERYLTLWVHYIDCRFSFLNLALATQRLTESSGEDLCLVEAQGKVMAQEWGITQPNLVLLGGEGRNKMRRVKREKGAEAACSVPHPISTTFLEREDSVSPQEAQGHSTEGLPSVSCFFSAVQGCIEEVMSHSIISKTLGQFQIIFATLFLPPARNRTSYEHHVQTLSQSLTREEEAELKSWTHFPPTWNKLYILLSTLVKYKSLFYDMMKEIKGEGLSKEDTGSESSSFRSCHANSSSMHFEWKVLEDLCLVLKPLDVACRTLAKEAFPRLSLVKPILTGLLSRHLVLLPGESSSIVKEVKRMMRRNLASCYDNPMVNRVLCVACALDPQFHGLRFMDDKEREATFEWLKKEAVRIVKENRKKGHGKKQSQNKRSPSPGSPESECDFLRRSKRIKESRPINFREMECADEESDAGEADESECPEPVPQAGLSGMEFLLGDLFCSSPKSRQSSVEESVDMEMSAYKADKGASLGVEPLQWWRMKAGQFPLLATAARAYLAAPAVAGSAAQDFAQEGAGAAHRKRGNIPPESLDSILFLHYNHMSTSESGRALARSDDRI
ncbi:Histone-lysine N-methyltransferase PRDM9 [Dissostichus eleginoides]|uniref:Histone-lysine N-methyltransferase PRDM9 n=1 Tax=Dissostichus eleginoides TaxID=100907 RepID=A0AAD9F295_DISEL|nr:Histone-lysine N-methyltransferase PRDM9 [Dissostichus eleginoides]